MTRRRRPGEPDNPSRSIRVNDVVWKNAINRAMKDGTTISTVVQLFIRGYGEGVIDPPRMHIVYPRTVSSMDNYEEESLTVS